MGKIRLDRRMFKQSNLHLADDPDMLVIDAVAVLLGEYSIERKIAANLILKIMLKDGFRKILFEDAAIYPTSRNDARVMKWRKDILSLGYCQKCGAKERLEAHHILHWSDYPIGRIDIKNGECLCHSCHTDEHVGEQVHHLMMATV